MISFGIRNALATFQRMIDHVIVYLEGFAVYLDNVMVFSQIWEGQIFHLCTVRLVPKRIA